LNETNREDDNAENSKASLAQSPEKSKEARDFERRSKSEGATLSPHRRSTFRRAVGCGGALPKGTRRVWPLGGMIAVVGMLGTIGALYPSFSEWMRSQKRALGVVLVAAIGFVVYWAWR